MTLPSAVEASQGRPAGLVSRMTADALDVLVAVIVVLIGYLGVQSIRFVLRPRVFRWWEPGTVNLSAFAASLFVIYLAAGWSVTGRTIGKQVMGLRAVRTDGRRIGAGRALVRAILCTFFPIGLLWCVVDRRHRAIHDLLLGTSVQYDWRRRVPTPALSGTSVTGAP
jgi:uncharacterized RDD family membrane protein YckC